jgi:ATP-dependent exoDNAse (exonuclease V) beta subunit
VVEGDREKGEKLHEFAEAYVNGEDVEASNTREEEVKEFIDSLDGELEAEKVVKIPSDGKVYEGVIDLIHKTDEKVEVIDYKTDSNPENMDEYTEQVECYRKGLEELFDRPVEKRIVCLE